MRLSSILAATVAVAALMPIAADAANSTVAVGNANGTTTAYVTPNRQLQTTMIAPASVVRAGAFISGNSCGALYTVPTGKAVVIPQITYDVGSGSEGTESEVFLHGTSNCGDVASDLADTTRAFESQSHTFPTGLPLADIYILVGGAHGVDVTFTGYLIPASHLPSEEPQQSGLPMKGMSRWRH